MGALENYINRVEKESGKWVAYWQLCTLESNYRRKYGRYPSKSELREYGNSLMEENSCIHNETSAPVNSASSSTDDSVNNVSFNKAYKIWK